ncbi:MAG: AIM24 family protein [Candidatus Sumerlaeia bacterium]|nr:AIM24 family protein [Candidatus Sumerlaeia bacterium]
MATFEIVEKQGLKMIRAVLNNDMIRAEAGAMHYMRGRVELETKMPTAGGFLKSMVTQETIFKPTYTGTGEVYFGPPTFGEYTVLHLNNEEWVLDKGAYVCSDAGVEVGSFRNKAFSGFMSGEGFFQTKASGTGKLVIKSPGALEIIDLVNDRLVVDGSFAVARQAHLNFSVKTAAKGIFGSMASGEGFVNVIEGTGRVYLAPVSNLNVSLVDYISAEIIGLIPKK